MRVLASAGIVIMISRDYCQAGGGQRLGSHGLGLRRRIGRRKEIIARFFAGTASTG